MLKISIYILKNIWKLGTVAAMSAYTILYYNIVCANSFVKTDMRVPCLLVAKTQRRLTVMYGMHSLSSLCPASDIFRDMYRYFKHWQSNLLELYEKRDCIFLTVFLALHSTLHISLCVSFLFGVLSLSLAQFVLLDNSFLYVWKLCVCCSLTDTSHWTMLQIEA